MRGSANDVRCVGCCERAPWLQGAEAVRRCSFTKDRTGSHAPRSRAVWKGREAMWSAGLPAACAVGGLRSTAPRAAS